MAPDGQQHATDPPAPVGLARGHQVTTITRVTMNTSAPMPGTPNPASTVARTIPPAVRPACRSRTCARLPVMLPVGTPAGGLGEQPQQQRVQLRVIARDRGDLVDLRQP